MRALALRLAASLADLSGESIAIILTMGLVLGTFPVYGCPTVLCLVAAAVLRVNAPALQLVNQLFCPLQLALLMPFVRVGGHVLGSSHSAPHNALYRISELTLQAVAGWFCISLPLGMLLYLVLWLALRVRRECYVLSDARAHG